MVGRGSGGVLLKMGLFNILRRKTEPGQDGTSSHDALRALEDRLYDVERELKGIRTEWESQYDSFRRLLAKLSKREQRAKEPEPESATQGGYEIVNPLARRLLDAQLRHSGD